MTSLFLCVATLAFCLFSTAMALTSVNSLRSQIFGREATEQFTPRFQAVDMTPVQFLIVSSSEERKVVYTGLKNFKSRTGRTFALIDSGLTDPRGLALDRDRGALYVADLGARKIFRYRILVKGGPDPAETSLVTDGIQVTLVEGVQAEWVAVDVNGDLFYTDEGTKTINRIPLATVQSMAEGTRAAQELTFISEKSMEATAALEQEERSTDPALEPIQVFQLYEGSVNPNVEVPAGIASDGLHLFWANKVGGGSAGSAVRGKVHPSLVTTPSGSQAFESQVLCNSTDTNFGLAKTNTMVFFTSNSSGTGAVYGVPEEGGESFCFISDLSEPRGLTWDGDQTIYVADTFQDVVWSFPVGRITENAPKTRAAVLKGAYGLALLSEKDRAFQIKAGSASLRPAGLLLLGLIASAMSGP